MSMGSFNITHTKFLIKLPTCNDVNVGNHLIFFLDWEKCVHLKF